jgi:hypothetical protein
MLIGKIQQLEKGGGFCFIFIVCVHGMGMYVWYECEDVCMGWKCMHGLEVWVFVWDGEHSCMVGEWVVYVGDGIVYMVWG